MYNTEPSPRSHEDEHIWSTVSIAPTRRRDTVLRMEKPEIEVDYLIPRSKITEID